MSFVLSRCILSLITLLQMCHTDAGRITETHIASHITATPVLLQVAIKRSNASQAADDYSDLVVVPLESLIAAAIGSGIVREHDLPAALCAAGFGADGTGCLGRADKVKWRSYAAVLSESLAAAFQSSFGAAAISQHSLFAVLHSAAVGGMEPSQSLVMTGVLARGLATFGESLDQLCNVVEIYTPKAARWLVNSSDVIVVGAKTREVFAQFGNVSANLTAGVAGVVNNMNESTSAWIGVGEWLKGWIG